MCQGLHCKLKELRFWCRRETNEWTLESSDLVAVIRPSIGSTQEGNLTKFWRFVFVGRPFCIALGEVS